MDPSRCLYVRHWRIRSIATEGDPKGNRAGCDDLSTACGSAFLPVRLTLDPDQSLACRTIYLTLLACQNTHCQRHWLVPA